MYFTTEKINSNVTILGGGPGGYVAAIRASQFGAKVVLVEKDDLGGTCTNRGCIPTKALLNVSKMISDSCRLKDYNIQIDSSRLDFSKILKEANSIAKEAREKVDILMQKNNVKVLKGIGRVQDHKTIEVDSYSGKKSIIDSSSIIIATGSSPLIPDIPGINNKNVMSSNDIFNNYVKPDRIAIIGAGAVGLEWGTIYNNFGSEVTVIEMMPRILPREDREITEYLKKLLNAEGIHIITGANIKEITRYGDELTLNLVGGENIKADLVLIATGRVHNSKGIGLKGLVDIDKGRIMVDDHMRTKTENIFAVGDVVGRWMLAHVAMQEGLVAGENAVGGDIAVKYNAVPRCVYTNPEVAFVGLSEEEASEQMEENIKTALYPLYANGRAMTMRRDKGLIKLVYGKKYGELLGAQIVAPQASELIQEIGFAINIEATLEDLANTIHAHPTLSEIIRECAFKGLGREVHI